MSDRWAAIAGAAGWEVSNLGQVRRLSYTIVKKSRGGGVHHRHFPERVMPLQLHSNGYLSVRLYPDDKTQMVGRLVCAAFNGPPPTGTAHADHINGDRADNRDTNLRWLSPQENRGRRNLAKGSRAGAAKLNDDAVWRVRDAMTACNDTPLQFDLRFAAELGVSRESIRNIRLGKTWRITHAE